MVAGTSSNEVWYSISALLVIFTSVAVADLNGDGKLDLPLANQTFNNVLVMLGNGDGSFQDALSFSVGWRHQSIAVGDFNGDGRLDLAVANADSNNVSLLLGNGDGSFEVSGYFGGGGRFLAVGDFNGDGKPDLVGNNQILINDTLSLAFPK